MRKLSLVPVFLLALSTAACAGSRRPLRTADTSLELERVVLYRNGIGYFERHGEVKDEVLRIKVRRDQVNDLLKSLTVIDRSNGKAVSVSMPLDPQSWANAALATLGPGRGSLAQVLDGLRGSEVVLGTSVGRIRGRIVMVEQIINEPGPEPRRYSEGIKTQPERDYKVTLLRGNDLHVVRLSKVRSVTLVEGDLAVQLHRRLDASAGEGMFQQIEIGIRLAGKADHDLVVSYVVAAPMWKPTYRVVLPENGKGQALLQGWAIVDNLSGEDWSDVSMSLTSGEPIAFEYDLHTPRDVVRTDLTESGVRKRARVAVGETTFVDDEVSLEEEVEREIAADEDRFAGADKAEPEPEAAKPSSASRTRKARKKKGAVSGPQNEGSVPGGVVGGRLGGVGGAAAPPPPPAVDYDALRRSTQATARAQSVSGLSRYDLGERVTVPNGSSTMVGIINDSVEAEETFLYKPGGAGIGYDANPYRVVRFKNSTPFVLEPGPISIYSGGSFVGEGLSEAVGTSTSATIPFAVEPGIMVTSKVARSGDEMHLLRIVRGVLEVESYARTETTWTAKGQRKDGFKVLVRHSKAGWNYEITDEPAGTEELPDGYLVPVVVLKGQSEGSVTVIEQTPSRTSLSIWDGRAPGLLEKLMIGGDLTPQMRKTLQPVIDLRLEIGRIDTEIEGLKRQQVELDQRAEETRRNLEAIKKDSAAGSLRKKLSKRLGEFTSEADALGRKVVELQSKRLEKKIELEDLLQDIDLRPPSKSKPTKNPAPAKLPSQPSKTSRSV